MYGHTDYTYKNLKWQCSIKDGKKKGETSELPMFSTLHKEEDITNRIQGLVSEQLAKQKVKFQKNLPDSAGISN